MKWITENPIIVAAGAGAILTIVGAFWGADKRRALGRRLGALLNRILGKQAADKLETMVDDVVEGAKEDNEKGK